MVEQATVGREMVQTIYYMDDRTCLAPDPETTDLAIAAWQDRQLVRMAENNSKAQLVDLEGDAECRMARSLALGGNAGRFDQAPYTQSTQRECQVRRAFSKSLAEQPEEFLLA